MGPNQVYATFRINILQDLHGQYSHFQVLMRFLKRARKAASRTSTGTCRQSWLARYGIASSSYFDEGGFLSGECESCGDCTYFLLTWKYHS